MTAARLKKRVSSKRAAVVEAPISAASLLPRSSLAEHVHRIGILGKRIEAYIQYMSQMDEHSGLSDELKTRAAVAFYEKLLVVEQQLGRIHDEYRLE